MARKASALLFPTLGLALLIGAAVGIGGFTFAYAKGYSYLKDDPAACANCHVMEQQYASWMKSSHHTVATCNDCHTPHDPVGKYYVKAKNGFWHSFYFTTGTFPEPIRITAGNREVAEAACRNCHGTLVQQMDGGHPHAEAVACAHCHGAVGHPDR